SFNREFITGFWGSRDSKTKALIRIATRDKQLNLLPGLKGKGSWHPIDGIRQRVVRCCLGKGDLERKRRCRVNHMHGTRVARVKLPLAHGRSSSISFSAECPQRKAQCQGLWLSHTDRDLLGSITGRRNQKAVPRLKAVLRKLDRHARQFEIVWYLAASNQSSAHCGDLITITIEKT